MEISRDTLQRRAGLTDVRYWTHGCAFRRMAGTAGFREFQAKVQDARIYVRYTYITVEKGCDERNLVKEGSL
jgi:hypothetical protein